MNLWWNLRATVTEKALTYLARLGNTQSRQEVMHTWISSGRSTESFTGTRKQPKALSLADECETHSPVLTGENWDAEAILD